MGPSASKLWPTVAPDWIMNGPEWLESLGYDLYKTLIYDDRYLMFVDGLINTLKLTALALILGVLLISSVVQHLKILVDKFDTFAITGKPVPEDNGPYLTRRDELGQLHRHFDKMTRDYDRMTRDNYEQQRLLQEKQMQQLRAQVRPHFLYNTLESIYCLAKTPRTSASPP